MRTRALGRTGHEVPVVVFGAWALGGTGWGGTDDELASAALRTALDVGMTAIDTAPIYGRGHSESVVGAALEGRRDEAFLMTKCGIRWDSDEGELVFETKAPDGTPVRIHANGRPASVRHEVERSLARLRTDRIDLLQVHRPDTTTPIAETMGALSELFHEGKIRAVGVSNFSPEQLEEARTSLGDLPLASEQPRYSLIYRDIEADVVPYALEHDVSLLVYSPLEQGLLTGKVSADRTFPDDDGRSRRPSFRAENRARVNACLAEVVQPIAAAHGATLGQTCLAWTLARPGVTSVLVGARNPEQVHENAGAANVELSAGERATIEAAFCALELDLAG